jgi:hypothetical protein
LVREPDDVSCLPEGKAEINNESMDGFTRQCRGFPLLGHCLIQDCLGPTEISNHILGGAHNQTDVDGVEIHVQPNRNGFQSVSIDGGEPAGLRGQIIELGNPDDPPPGLPFDFHRVGASLAHRPNQSLPKQGAR